MSITPDTPSIAGDALSATPIAPTATPETAPYPTAPDLNVHGMDPLPPEFLPPSGIAGYHLPPSDDAPAAMAADRDARGWMLQAGLPAQIGNFIGEEISRMSALNGGDLSGGDDSAFELGRAGLMSQLHNLYGPDGAEKKLADVQWLIETVDRKTGGRLGDYLEANAGVLLNVAVVGQLAVHAERMRGRLR